MRQAVQILLHSIRQVLGNFGAALRLSALPYVVQIGVSLMLARSFLGSATGDADSSAYDRPGAGFFVALFVMIVTSLIIAVNWHRFILLNERPGLIPALHGRAMWAYALRILLISLVVGLIAVPLVIIPVALAATTDSIVLIKIISLFAAVAGSIVVLRFSVSLPAMALGEKMPFSAGWNSMTGHGGTAVGLAVILLLAQFAMDTAVSVFAFSLPLLVAANLIAGWVSLMVGLSVLTTLYGHYVEGRSLR